jgi:hypothetical protein
VISVAFGATILSFVLPRILGDVLHSERTAALWVLAHKRRRIPGLGTLARAVHVALSKLARRCLNDLIASRISAMDKNTCTLAEVHTGVRAKWLNLSCCGEAVAALLARMAMLGYWVSAV